MITMMNTDFETAKAHKKLLEERNNIHSNALKAFSAHKTDSGLTPDYIKVSPEWRKAKDDFNRSFAELRKYNGWYVKEFKKEIAQERKNKYKTV